MHPEELRGAAERFISGETRSDWHREPVSSPGSTEGSLKHVLPARWGPGSLQEAAGAS